MKLTFEEFYEKLCANDIWFDQMKMRFFRKDMRGAANDCYIFLLASESRWNAQDYQDFRRCYQSFLSKSKDVQQGPTLQQAEVKKESGPQEPILTGPERQARINEWLEQVRQAEMLNNSIRISYKEIADEGDWLPKKPEPYPSTSKSEVIKRLLHDEWTKLYHDPRTGDRTFDWIEESEWRKTVAFADLEINGLDVKLIVEFKINGL